MNSKKKTSKPPPKAFGCKESKDKLSPLRFILEVYPFPFIFEKTLRFLGNFQRNFGWTFPSQKIFSENILKNFILSSFHPPLQNGQRSQADRFELARDIFNATKVFNCGKELWKIPFLLP